jgi:hypothetical protein
MYLDSLIYKDLAHMGKETPRVLVLDEQKLTAISRADRDMAAQKGSEDWAFGKIIVSMLLKQTFFIFCFLVCFDLSICHCNVSLIFLSDLEGTR